MSDVHPILVPLLNVNDDTVVIAEWLVEHGQQVGPGEPICVVETSKAAAELEAEHEGILYQVAEVDTVVPVGEPIGLIGPNLAAVEAYLAEQVVGVTDQTQSGAEATPLRATPRARSLAEEYGVALEQVATMGVVGTIKEADVQRYLSERLDRWGRVELKQLAEVRLPQPILERVVADGELSRHEKFVVQGLKQTLQGVILAAIEAEVELTSISELVQGLQCRGTMVTLLHVVLCALGQTLPHFPRLISFQHAGQIYRYRDLDIAFVARVDGRLFTPVVRNVDRLSLAQVAKACQTASLRVIRGKTKPEELEGACFTVSHVATPGILRFMALPNRFQSAILAVAAEQRRLALGPDGSVHQIPVIALTLSYDHALCDAMYAAEFLSRLGEEMGRVSA